MKKLPKCSLHSPKVILFSEIFSVILTESETSCRQIYQNRSWWILPIQPCRVFSAGTVWFDPTRFNPPFFQQRTPFKICTIINKPMVELYLLLNSPISKKIHEMLKRSQDLGSNYTCSSGHLVKLLSLRRVIPLHSLALPILQLHKRSEQRRPCTHPAWSLPLGGAPTTRYSLALLWQGV